MSEWKWNKSREKAAVLVAEDLLTNAVIAAQTGISHETLAQWKRNEEFIARVDEHVKAFAIVIRSQGIGRLENRVARLNRDWRKLQIIVDERSDRAAKNPHSEPESAGMETGLIVRKETPTKFGTVVEFVVDTGLLAELRALEMQAAKELGQIVDRADKREWDMSQFDDAEVDRIAAGEAIERVYADARRRREREAQASAGEAE